MTGAADRRTLLRLAAGALLLPVAARSRALAPAGHFDPPHEPMRYTRRLERSLADGASLAVSRSFAVRFLHAGPGFRVEGEQVAVEVAAPDKLAEFARIERERREEGLFPLSLDGNGQLVEAARPPLSAQLDAAVREAMAEIERRPREPAERAELRRFVGAIRQSAGRLTTELPSDLFAPSAPERRETRAVPLPGGGAGQVTVTFTAAADPATGLMREAAREIVTELAGDRRLTIERWQLEPLI